MEARIASVIRRIAADHAASVRYPEMMFSGEAPVGAVAQRMVDGKYDKRFLLAEIRRFTGVDLSIPEKPGQILMIVPQHGYWSSELTLPDQVFRAAGYEIDYATPRGARPFVYPVSVDPTFRDQAWNALQVSAGEAALGERYDDPSTPEGARLSNCKSLNDWVPPTPRPQHGPQSRAAYRERLQSALREASKYAAMVIVGGGGASLDLGGNTSMRPLIQLMLELDRPVAAICYGVEALIQVANPKTKRPLVEGRIATGHSEQDDYTDGTAIVVRDRRRDDNPYSPNFGSAPVTLEQMIKQYTAPGGGFISTDGTPYMAVMDGPFITARTTPDGYPASLLALAYLHGAGGLPRRFIIDGDQLGRVPLESEILKLR